MLHPAEGRAVEIQVGDPAPAGGVAVRNVLTQRVFAVDAELAALLAPRAEAFRRGTPRNSWEARLRGPTARPDQLP